MIEDINVICRCRIFVFERSNELSVTRRTKQTIEGRSVAGAFVRFSKQYHECFGSVLADRIVKHFLSSEEKMANSRQIPGRRGRGGEGRGTRSRLRIEVTPPG